MTPRTHSWWMGQDRAGLVSDAEIAAVPYAISASSVAVFFGVSGKRVEQVRKQRPELKHRDPAYMDAEPIGAVMREQDHAADAENGSYLLLRAQLKSGQHFITDPEQYRAACLSVGLARAA